MKQLVRGFAIAAPLSALAIVLAAGCSGGGSSTSMPVATAAPSGCGVSAPASSAPATQTLTAGVPMPLPLVGYCSGSLTLQSGSTVSGTVTFTGSLTAPAGAPTPGPAVSPGGAPTSIYWVTMQLNGTSTIGLPAGSGSPSLLFIDAGAGTCKNYYDIFSGTSLGAQGYGGPIAASGTVVGFPGGTQSTALTLDSTQTYYIGLVCL